MTIFAKRSIHENISYTHHVVVFPWVRRLAFFVGSKQPPSPKATPLTPSKEHLLAYYWDLRHGVITQQAVKDLFPDPSAEALWTYPHRAHDPEAAPLALPSQHKILLVPFVKGDHAQAADAFLSANVFPDMGASLMPEERLAFYEELRKHMGEVIEQFQRSTTDILRVLPEGGAFTGARSLCHRLLSVNIPTGKDEVFQELASLKTHKDTAKEAEKLLEETMEIRNKDLATLSELEDKLGILCKSVLSKTQERITKTLNEKTTNWVKIIERCQKNFKKWESEIEEDEKKLAAAQGEDKQTLARAIDEKRQNAEKESLYQGEAESYLMATKEAQSFWEQKELVIDEIISHLDQSQLEEALTLYENDLANLGHEGPDCLYLITETQPWEELKDTANTLKEVIQSAQTKTEQINTAMAIGTCAFKRANHNLNHILFHHQRVSQMLYMHSIGKQLEKEMEAEPYDTSEISNEKFNLTWIQRVMDREITRVNGFWQSFCALGKDWQPGQGVKAEQGVFQATEPRDGTEIKHWKEFEGLAQDL
ncbi:hypothetical protein [Candidatus Hepatobacter penaei]|uniref:hypothetical protein n=1 Tax=Candidatus Hepatobacter penaei TaxID=1274402 RepID=UPI0004F36DF2|nr:hypothetical protein [Candidatus Hepatobacter penaei]